MFRCVSAVLTAVVIAVFAYGFVPAFAVDTADDGDAVVVVNDAKANLSPAPDPVLPDDGAVVKVPSPELFGYIQFIGKDLLDDPMARFKMARLCLIVPMKDGWKFQAMAQRSGGKYRWVELNIGQSTPDWDYAVGVSTTSIGYAVPPPHGWVLITYPNCTDLVYTSVGVFGRLKVGDTTVRAAVVNGDDDIYERLSAVSFRVELPTQDKRSALAISSHYGNDYGRDRELISADFHTGWKGGFSDAFYAWDNGSQPFNGGYWLIALGDQTKFIAEADYYKQPRNDGKWGYAFGVNHDFRSKTHKQSQLRLELRNAGSGEWVASTLIQVAIN